MERVFAFQLNLINKAGYSSEKNIQLWNQACSNESMRGFNEFNEKVSNITKTFKIL